ncbi:MAG: hypothetical protein ACFB0D_00610 [Phormidesmis sp.]
METPNAQLKKTDIIEKLDKVPHHQLENVSQYIDSLLVQADVLASGANGSEAVQLVEQTAESPLERQTAEDWKKAWSEWFAERDQMLSGSESNEEDAKSLASLTKQERRDLLTEILVEKYEAMGLNLS